MPLLPHRFGLVFLAFCLAAVRLAADGTDRDFHIPSLYHVGFWVHDVERSRAFYKTYLGFDEPYRLNRESGALQLVAMKVNDRQVIYLFPNAAKILPNGDNLDHLGLETDNVAALRDYLIARGVHAGQVQRARLGDLILAVKDPDGHAIEFTQFEPEGQLMKHQGKSLPAGRTSSHLLSAAIAAADFKASLHFYCDILGFKEIWRQGGRAPRSIHLQVPDGADYLDLRPYEKEPGSEPARAVPEFYLEVPDAAKAAESLAQRAQAAGFPAPELSDDKREASCVDPDGTRVVLKTETP